MDTKKLVWLGFFVGSAIGSYVPVIWGGSLFSFTSVVLTAVGALIGIWAGYRISQ